MTTSTNFTDVQGYKDFVETFGADLISKGFYGNKTAQMVTGHDGVKGKKILTQLTLGTLGRRYSSNFAPPADTLGFKPRTLSVEAGKFELAFVPQDFESSYLGQFRTRTFNDSDMVPFEGFIMNKVMEKKAQEIEDAMWRAVAAASPASTDELSELFDGYLQLLTDAVTAGDITPVATPGGSITQSNVVELIESMWDTLDAAYQDLPIGVFVNPKIWSMYQRAYRNDYSKYTDSMQTGRMKLDFCNGEIIRTPGMGTSNRILMTPVDNLHYGYDGLDDATVFNFEKDHRELHYWSDFKIGVQIGILEDGVVAVNDLT